MSKSAANADKNGSGVRRSAARAAPKSEARPGELRQARFAMAFSQIVAVLMRDPTYRKLRLADLEWLVLPPLMAGQFRVAQATVPSRGKVQVNGKGQGEGKGETQGQGSGVLVPVAVALWARVSPNLDKALSENLDKAGRLRPADWVSGDNLWLMAVAGDQKALPTFLKQLREQDFKGKQVKTRVRGADGKVAVKTLGKPS